MEEYAEKVSVRVNEERKKVAPIVRLNWIVTLIFIAAAVFYFGWICLTIAIIPLVTNILIINRCYLEISKEMHIPTSLVHKVWRRSQKDEMGK